ncbi:MAG: Clp protease N-terminal domain-containing protein [Planctomycetota bacterium]
MPEIQKIQIRQILDELTISRFKDSKYLQNLKRRYRHLVHELEYVEKKIKKSAKEPQEDYDWDAIHRRVLQDIFVTSQSLEIAQNLERDFTTHLYLQFCTDSFIQVIQTLHYQKKTVTIFSLFLAISKQKETYSAKLLQKLGDLSLLEKETEVENSTILSPVAIAPSGLEVLQESLKWARKLNWARLSTEHLLWAILLDPKSLILKTLKKPVKEIYPLLCALKNFLEINDENIMKPFELQDLQVSASNSEDQVRLLREIRDLLRDQGKKNIENQKKFQREEKTFKGILLSLTLLLLVLSIYIVGIVFFFKSS